MSEIIRIRHLSKQYRPPDGPLAVSDIELDIREGEIFSLLGPNGAGKTTLISLLCGLLPPTAGDAIVAGHSVVQEPMAVKRIVGVVPEEIALYPRLSGRRNLRYFGQLYGLRGPALDQAVAEALAVVELTDRGDDRVAHYSNGMKRRLNTAVGLLHRPRILLLDEPTLGLDPAGRRRILDLVQQLRRERGITILTCTHHMDEAQELSDRVGIIHRGHLIAIGSPDELIRSLDMETILRLRVNMARVPAGVVNALQRLDGVGRITVNGHEITISLRHTDDAWLEALRLVTDAGMTVQSWTVQRPTLETVFLQLTGERLTGGAE